MLEHGGRLLRAVRHYGIPREDWLDLSSGIAPWPYPIPPIPTQAWARLPETEDGLEEAARRYYGARQLLPVAGSQAAIQALPTLRQIGRVGVLSPCYAEHPLAWQRAGHELVELDDDGVDAVLDSLDVLVLVNPNNPTGRCVPRMPLQQALARSVVDCAERRGLIVLRSFGKFFGLAGVRLGCVVAELPLLQRLAESLGPWTVSGPTRVLAQACFVDQAAHAQQMERSNMASQRLAALLREHGLAPDGGCDLFQYVRREDAAQLHEFLARRGILVRLFVQPAALRLGLPANDADERRLAQALAAYQKETA